MILTVRYLNSIFAISTRAKVDPGGAHTAWEGGGEEGLPPQDLEQLD